METQEKRVCGICPKSLAKGPPSLLLLNHKTDLSGHFFFLLLFFPCTSQGCCGVEANFEDHLDGFLYGIFSFLFQSVFFQEYSE